MVSIEEIENNPLIPMSVSTGEPVAFPKNRVAQRKRLAASEAAMECGRQRIAAGFPPGKYPRPAAANDNSAHVRPVAA